MNNETMIGNPHGDKPEEKPEDFSKVVEINWEKRDAALSPAEQEKYAPIMKKMREDTEADKKREAEKTKSKDQENIDEIRRRVVEPEYHQADPRHFARVMPAVSPEQKSEESEKKEKSKGFWAGIKNIFK